MLASDVWIEELAILSHEDGSAVFRRCRRRRRLPLVHRLPSRGDLLQSDYLLTQVIRFSELLVLSGVV